VGLLAQLVGEIVIQLPGVHIILRVLPSTLSTSDRRSIRQREERSQTSEVRQKKENLRSDV
jgi:hypothetical protein